MLENYFISKFRKDEARVNRKVIILLATMACGLIVSLMYIGKLTTRLSHMENTVLMIEEKLCDVNPGTNEFARTVKDDSTIEIERTALYAAYQVEKADFDSSHKMMGGSHMPCFATPSATFRVDGNPSRRIGSIRQHGTITSENG